MVISWSRLIPVVLAAVMLMNWNVASADDPTSYPMVCRGGGAMQARLVDVAPSNILPVRGFQIQFARSTEAASRREPGPGECAWLDRAIGPDEPSTLVLSTPESDETAFDVVVRQGSITLEPAARTPSLLYLINEIYGGRVFYVQCYQKRGRGPNYFVITRTGP